MDSNFGRRADHFVILTDISRSEIDENVNDEHDINCRKKVRNSIRVNFIWIYFYEDLKKINRVFGPFQ